MLQGGLFTRYFLGEGIKETPAWKELADADVAALRGRLSAILAAFASVHEPNEHQTEDDLICKVFDVLGWEGLTLRQQNLSAKGRVDIPDLLLFPDADAKASANTVEEWRRYAQGVAIVESKRWQRQLDRPDAMADEKNTVPSTQMVRYLRRLGDITAGKVRWGILTNGRHWRLYWEGATSIAEGFLELDLPAVLGLPGFQPALSDIGADDLFRVFILMFRRQAFLPGTMGRTFHQDALEGGRQWGEKVSASLSGLVFGEIFPRLVEGIAAHDPEYPRIVADGYLEAIRDGALILLYRLLFVLYAEDRNLLPARDPKYDDYGMGKKVRDDIARKVDGKVVFAAEAGPYYNHLKVLFRLIDKGGDSIGLPPYNGGLFDPERTPILDRIELPDRLFAPLVDKLSRHDDDGTMRHINYRDLSVQQLGSIYERLLENELIVADGAVKVADDGDARHGSGSFYTPEEPVQLIIAQAVGPLVRDRMAAFESAAAEMAKDKRAKAARLKDLARLDPASRILDIKVCDPAMGSGHFLVSLVDYLADRVLDAVAQAGELVDWADYHSPLTDGIGEIRNLILARKREKKWTFDEALLDDKQMIRRMILKRVVYGVDKNPMAVELAKVSLWLHTFTAGAPLSFLEHHLRCGDSICGEWIRPVEDELAKRGTMFLHGSVARAKDVAKAMTEIERLADADIAQVKASSNFFETVRDATVALARFLDFVHVLRWREKLDKPTMAAIQAFYDGQFGDPVKLAAGLIKPKTPARQSHAALIPGEAATPAKSQARPAESTYSIVVALLAEARRLSLKERFLHWQVAFPGLWSDWESATPVGGFDAVIGNPPYVRQELLGPAKPFLKKAYASFDGMADLYVYFYELGLKILRPGGRLSFIVTNKWMKAGYAEPLRRTFGGTAWIESVIDFGHAKQIFKDADVFPCVIVARRPTPDEAPPDETRVCVIDRDRLRLDALVQQVEEESFPMPRERLDAREWSLEAPAVSALMDKIAATGVALRRFIGTEPMYGLKTGYNEAFLIGTAARDELVATEAGADAIIRPYLRGQDINRWSPAWDGLWMIVLKSSANHPWPWSEATDEIAAEAVFRETYPRLHAHMKSHEEKLRARQDQGRFWWELRACAYYDSFLAPKIFYQEIQYHPSYALDRTDRYGNNKTFFIPADLYVLGVLNSPLMWWHNWRFLSHMKDEALTPAAFRMETLPIAEPTPGIRAAVEDKVSRLVDVTADLRRRHGRILDWLVTEMAVAKPGQRLRDETAVLSSDDFVAEVKKSRTATPLGPVDLARLRDAHADLIAPANPLRAEAIQLERAISDLVNRAYGLTPEEVDLMWKTAPPRMPFSRPA